jgi:general secretion pathway protein J
MGPVRQRAFTLVEVLVVLVIVSLVSGILIQALGQVFQLQHRFGEEMAYSRQDAMAADWFRQGIEGLQPDYQAGANRFKGAERSLSGLTTNPLSSDYGATFPLRLEIKFDPQSGTTRLVHGEARSAAAILSWPGNSGRFRYLDQKGEEHETWPPPLGLWPQIPTAVRLEADLGGTPTVVVAVPMGPAIPLQRASDVFAAMR